MKIRSKKLFEFDDFNFYLQCSSLLCFAAPLHLMHGFALIFITIITIIIVIILIMIIKIII